MASEDTPKRNKLTRRDITKLALRSLFNQSAMNYERMQADGWAYAMMPVLKKTYGDDKKGFSAAMKA
ncbi:PTS N-acetylgalactosamine transporter subunit IID, partial [Vibrio parahaemolyticus]